MPLRCCCDRQSSERAVQTNLEWTHTVSATYCWGRGSSGALGIGVNNELYYNATAITGI
jgi:hypothetical protein